MRPEDEFLSRCRRAGIAGINATRLQIVAAAFELPEPVSFELLQAGLDAWDIRASRPTIYRTMHMLARVGLMVQPDPQQPVWLFTYDGGKFRSLQDRD
jgi:Fe2+ or Zn2+ uptake regulation protein